MAKPLRSVILNISNVHNDVWVWNIVEREHAARRMVDEIHQQWDSNVSLIWTKWKWGSVQSISKDIPPYNLVGHGLELVLHLLQQRLNLWSKKQKYCKWHHQIWPFHLWTSSQNYSAQLIPLEQTNISTVPFFLFSMNDLKKQQDSDNKGIWSPWQPCWLSNLVTTRIFFFYSLWPAEQIKHHTFTLSICARLGII